MGYEFPESAVIAKLLSDLVGAPVELAKADDAVALDRLGRPFACVCLDDQSLPVGAMIADLSATVSLGGQLMMLAEDELKEQTKSKAPSEDVVSALSEIFNNLTTTLNNIKANPHIRSTPAKPAAAVVASNTGAWIPRASHRVDLTGNLLCGKGRLILFWK